MTSVFDANSTLPTQAPQLIRRMNHYMNHFANETPVIWPTGTTIYRTLPDWTRLLPPIFIPAPIQYIVAATMSATMSATISATMSATMSAPIGTSLSTSLSSSETDYTWDNVVLEEVTEHDITLSCLEIMRHVTNMERVRKELHEMHNTPSHQEKKHISFSERLTEAKQLWESACAVENVERVVLGTPEYDRVLDRLRMWMAIKKVAE